MQVFARIISAIACTIAALSVVGCASGPTVTPTQLGQIRGGQQSAIIMAYRTTRQLNFASVTFQNLATGASYDVSMGSQGAWVAAGPGMVMVPPGRYRVSRGTISDSNAHGEMPLLQYWFDSFDVAPGEVVDVGTLTIDDITANSMPGTGDRVLNTLLTLDPREHSTYFAYNIDYSDEARVQHMLETNYPDLGVAPVRRPLTIVLDRERFARAIADSYAPHADGSLPTPQEAHDRVRAELTTLLSERLQTPGPKPTEPAS